MDRDPDERSGAEWTERREGPSVKLIVVGVAAVLLLIFIVQNATAFEVNLLFWDADVPLWILILGAAVIGFAVGWILGRIRDGRGKERADP
jgi:uncharacterized integral membrane protein